MSSLRSVYCYESGEYVFPKIETSEIDVNNVPISGGGGGSVAGAVGYVSDMAQTISPSTNTVLLIGAPDPENTFGTTSLTAYGSVGDVSGFENTGTSNIFVIITGYCTFTSNSGGESGYALWISKNGSNTDRYGYSETPDNTDMPTLNFSCSLQMAPNDYIQLNCWTNNPNTGTEASVSVYPGLRFIIAQLNQGTSSNPSNPQDLEQVLTEGNDAGNTDIINVGNLSVNKYLSIANAVGNSSQLHLNYDDGTSSGGNYQLIALNGDLLIQRYDGDSIQSQPFLIDGSNCVYLGNSLATIPYVYVIGSQGAGQVYDTRYNVPPSVASTFNLRLVSQSWTSNIVLSSSSPNTILNLSPSALPSSNLFELLINNFRFYANGIGTGSIDVIFNFYLAPTSGGAYDNTKANYIQLSMSSGDIPSINGQLYYSNSSAQTALYLCCAYVSGTYTSGYIGLGNGLLSGSLRCSNAS